MTLRQKVNIQAGILAFMGVVILILLVRSQHQFEEMRKLSEIIDQQTQLISKMVKERN